MVSKNRVLLGIGLSVLASTVLMSSEMDRIIEQSGASVTTTKLGDKTSSRSEAKNVYNYQEVIYQRLLDEERQNTNVKESNTDIKFARSNIGEKEKELALLAKKVQKELTQEKEQNKIYNQSSFASGYCYVDDEISVERLSTYAYLQCDFKEPVGHATLAMTISPDFYARALIGTPLYIEKGDKRFPVASGAVLTKDKNSINIANLINDRKVAKLTATGIYTATSVATSTAQKYLAMKEEAATDTNVDTIATSSGTTTISTTNTAEVPLQNYIISGTLDLVSSLTKVIGESVIETLPYTFKIYKGSTLFVDVELTSNNQINGFKAVNADGTLIRQEPVFELDGTQHTITPSKVKQREDK